MGMPGTGRDRAARHSVQMEGMSESLRTRCPALSPKGNPTLKALLAVLKSVGLRLSVESETRIHA